MADERLGPNATPDNREKDIDWLSGVEQGWCANCGHGIYKLDGKWVHDGNDKRECNG